MTRKEFDAQQMAENESKSRGKIIRDQNTGANKTLNKATNNVIIAKCKF